MSLTDQEKQAGRKFLPRAQALFQLARGEAVQRGAILIPSEIATFRHECKMRDGRTWRGLRTRSLHMVQCSVLSPAYPEHGIEAERFAFIWNLGYCKTCGLEAIGDEGWLADAQQRPPLSGARKVKV